MRYVSIFRVKPDDIAAMDIMDPNGILLVSRGTMLTGQIIERLRNLGFQGIYIGDEISVDIELPETITPELRALAKECIRTLNVKDSVQISKSIIEEMMEKQIVALDMRDIRSFDDYTYAHSVNVAVLSCVIGIAMKLESDELQDLVNAAILHDFGKLKVPAEIMNKKERLTGAEYEAVKAHPQYSYDIIRDSADISEQTKRAVLEHHENEDGSGYPNGKSGNEICKLAKILHVADVYDALISNRPFKEGYAPWEAAEYLMGGGGINFSQNIVDSFIKLSTISNRSRG